MRSRCPCLWAGQGWRSWVLGAQWRGPATYRQENLALGATWHLPKALPQAAASSPGSSMTWAWLGHILGMSWACPAWRGGIRRLPGAAVAVWRFLGENKGCQVMLDAPKAQQECADEQLPCPKVKAGISQHLIAPQH